MTPSDERTKNEVFFSKKPTEKFFKRGQNNTKEKKKSRTRDKILLKLNL